MKKDVQIKETENKKWPMTILLLILGIAILIPLYMAFVIAIKQPYGGNPRNGLLAHGRELFVHHSMQCSCLCAGQLTDLLCDRQKYAA